MSSMFNLSVAAVQKEREDPLAYLPCSKILEYRRGQTIHDPSNPSKCINLVLAGNVKVGRIADNERPVVVDIYRSDEFFGESALIGSPDYVEFSVALDDTRVITWTTEQIEEISMAHPKLAIAFTQLMVQRTLELTKRIESLAFENIDVRLARALLRFGERLGHEGENGSLHTIALTHELLSQYVGTSREVVTHYMNEFRRKGFLEYSRRSTVLQPEAMKTWLTEATAYVAPPADHSVAEDAETSREAWASPAASKAAA